MGGELPYVHVCFTGPFRDALAGEQETLDLEVHPGLVRSVDGDRPPPVLLSVLAVRCMDYWSNTTWSDYSVTSDGLHRDLVDGPHGLFHTLAGEFEMYTAFVKSTGDLDRISASWAQAALQGLNTVAWYFLWPQHRTPVGPAERCCARSGSVHEQRLFALYQRIDRAGIRSGWPHPCSLYRQLCGKLWIPQMSLNKAHCVPPTTRVQYADLRVDAHRTAEQAICRLIAIRQQVWDRPAVSTEEFSGVAKLGFLGLSCIPYWANG